MTLNLHPEWDFIDGNVWLRAEDTIFRVHRYVLMRGEYWYNYFAPMQSGASVKIDSNLERQGCRTKNFNRDNPLLVPPMHSADDFALLLSALYPKLPPRDYDLAELKRLHEMADFYTFEDLRRYTANRLKQADLPPLEMLALAVEENDLGWELEAYVKLCTTVAPVDYAALMQVFQRWISTEHNRDGRAILHLREMIRDHLYKRAAQSSSDYGRACVNATKCEIDKMIKTAMSSALGKKDSAGKFDSSTIYSVIMEYLEPIIKQAWISKRPCSYCLSVLKERIEDVLDLPALRKLCKECVPWLREVEV